ncbi:LYPD2 protein, partial [Smithornis capensis]|nr:LYPD2 protein [Smithornis capensis]
TLQCYTCRDLTPVEKCVTIENCSDTENMCKTTTYSLEEGKDFCIHAFMCSSVCVPSDVDGIGMTRPVSCCYSDLCNTDGAASLR